MRNIIYAFSNGFSHIWAITHYISWNDLFSFNFPLVFLFKTYSEFVSVSFSATSLGQVKSLQLRSGTETSWESRKQCQDPSPGGGVCPPESFLLPFSTSTLVIWEDSGTVEDESMFQGFLKGRVVLLTDLDCFWKNIVIGMINCHLVLLPAARCCGKGRDKESGREITWTTRGVSFHIFHHPSLNYSVSLKSSSALLGQSTFYFMWKMFLRGSTLTLFLKLINALRIPKEPLLSV